MNGIQRFLHEMRDNIINAILMLFLASAVLLAAEQKATMEVADGEQVASVGPLLDSMATICGEAFDARRHKLVVVGGEVVGCEVVR